MTLSSFLFLFIFHFKLITQSDDSDHSDEDEEPYVKDSSIRNLIFGIKGKLIRFVASDARD